MQRTRISPVAVFSVMALLLLTHIPWSVQNSISKVISTEQLATYRYTSKPLGFEVDLPEDWNINEYLNVGFGFSFLSPRQTFDKDGNLIAGAYITVWVSDPVPDPTALTPSNAKSSGMWITAGGEPALKYRAISQRQDAQVIVDVYRNTFLYRFALQYNTIDAERATYIDIFEAILTSLTFTAREGTLPVKTVALPASTLSILSHYMLSFPFEAGHDWRITNDGGYNNYNMHQGYALYALDFQRSDSNTGGKFALAPTSGKLSWIETTAPKCIDISIDQVSASDDLYLQICHIDLKSYLSNGSPLTKAQVLGAVATDGCGGYCETPHIHIAAFIGKRGNPWTDPSSMTAVPFVTEYNLALDSNSFPPDGSRNQYGGSCCYRSSIVPIGDNEVAVALIIDATGSMDWNDPQGMRKAAGKVFIDTAQLGDKIAVVGFDSTDYHFGPLRTIQSRADRDALKAAADQIGNWWNGTDINVGLQGGFNELLSDTTIDNKKAAILLTDGEHNVGPYNPQSHLQYRDQGWPVYTVGLGDNTGESLLQQIAADTEGQYIALTDPNQLQALYFEISQQIAGGDLILNTSVTMTQGSSQQVAVGLPSDQSSATFFIGWPGSEVSMNLTSPSGRQIDPSTTAPDVYHAKDLTYEIYTIQYPEFGQWVMTLHGTSLPAGGEEVDVRVAVRGPRFVYLPVVFRNYSPSTQPTPPTNTPTYTPTATNTPIPTDTPTPTPTVGTLNFRVSFQARDNADNKPQNVPIKVKIKNLSGDQTLFETTDWVWVTPAGSSDNWGTASVDVSSAGLVSGQSYQVFVKGAMHLAKRVTIPLTDGLTIDYTDLALNPDGVLWACDVNQDNQVSNTDVSIVLSHYGTAPTDPDPSSEVYRSDQNGDGVVNSFDHTICLTNLGKVGD